MKRFSVLLFVFSGVLSLGALFYLVLITSCSAQKNRKIYNGQKRSGKASQELAVKNKPKKSRSTFSKLSPKKIVKTKQSRTNLSSLSRMHRRSETAFLNSSSHIRVKRFVGKRIRPIPVSRRKKIKTKLNVSMTTLFGTTIPLNSLRGKVTVVHFWATYCAPCIPELKHELYPLFSFLTTRYQKTNARKRKILPPPIQFISVVVARPRIQLMQFLQSRGFIGSVVADPYSYWVKFLGFPGRVTLPITLVLDKNVALAKVFVGKHRWFSNMSYQQFLESLTREKNSTQVTKGEIEDAIAILQMVKNKIR